MDIKASHQLSFDDMQLFCRVASLGTLSAVARERNAPVSQISRAIKRIEEAWGIRLIHRTTHGLSLTAEGQTLNDHCQRMLATMDELDAEFSGQSGAVNGLVRVSTSSVVAEYLIVPSLPSLHERHPRLHVDLHVDDRIVDMAREGIDIAIRTGNAVTDTLVMRSLGTLGRGLYASPEYIRSMGMPQSMDDLQRHRLVSNSAHVTHNRWPFKSAHGEQCLISQGPFRSDSTAITAALALNGLGISRIVTLVGDMLVAQGRLVRVLEGSFNEPAVALSAVMLAERHRHPKIRACIDHWVDWFNRLAKA